MRSYMKNYNKSILRKAEAEHRECKLKNEMLKKGKYLWLKCIKIFYTSVITGTLVQKQMRNQIKKCAWKRTLMC